MKCPLCSNPKIGIDKKSFEKYYVLSCGECHKLYYIEKEEEK